MRGIPLTEPTSYKRAFGQGRRQITIGMLATALKRFISFSTAITFHLLLGIVLLWFALDQRIGHDDSTILVGMAGLNVGEEGIAETEEPAEVVKEEEPDPAPEEDPVPPKEEPKPAEEVVIEEPREETPEESEKEDKSLAEDADKESTEPEVIGPGESRSTPSIPAGDLADLVDDDPIKALKAKRAGTIARLRAGKESDIVVVEGAYDKVEEILKQLNIPHTRITYMELPDTDLANTSMLLVNCDTRFQANQFRNLADEKPLLRKRKALEERLKNLESKLKSAEKRNYTDRAEEVRREIRVTRSRLTFLNHRITRIETARASVEKIRTFVEEGGYLFTSDWGLTLIEKATPNHVYYQETVGPEFVRIEAVQSAQKHEYLEGVFDLHKTTTEGTRWRIDSSSYVIHVRGSRVTKLIDCPKLKGKGLVAVTFPHKKGQVLHVLSHFHAQKNNTGDFALQNMLLNFLMDRLLSGS